MASTSGARRLRVEELHRDGTITTVAGTRVPGSPATAAQLGQTPDAARSSNTGGVTAPSGAEWETAVNRRRPRRERGLRRSSQGRRGERGHQLCAEPSAALGSEGSSRTTGVRNACEREEGVRCVVLAWKLIVSFRSVTFDTRN